MSIFNCNKNNKNKQLKPCLKGFLFLELLVSLLVLSALTYVIAHYQGMSIRWQYETIKRFEAINKAHSYLAQLSPESANNGDATEDGFTLHHEVNEMDTTLIRSQLPFITSLETVRLINVEVEWQAMNQVKQRVQLNSAVVV